MHTMGPEDKIMLVSFLILLFAWPAFLIRLCRL